MDVTYWWLIPLAVVPAMLGMILIFLDQQITSVIVNRKEHKLKVSALPFHFCQNSFTDLPRFCKKRLENASSRRGWPFRSVSANLHYTDTGYGQHHQRTSSQQDVVVVQHVRSWLNLLYNILPPTDMLYTITNGRVHNNSTTCCTTNSPPTDNMTL